MATEPLFLNNPAAALRLNARRVMWLRAIAIPAPALLIVLGSMLYGVAVALGPLLVILASLLTMNAWTWWRLRAERPLSERELLAQLLFDWLALTGTLYYSGGIGNPFALFFLLPLIISATVLPRRYTWLMAAVTVASYSGLMVFRRPLPEFIPDDEQAVFDLHIIGMWLGFVLIALLVAQFVAAMGESLRERDRKLAAARERALQDESLLALATQAAGAAHELSTPLATMAVLAGELSQQLADTEQPELRDQLELMRTQIQRCKESLSRIANAAGATRSDDCKVMSVAEFIDEIAEQLRNLRPGCQLNTAVTRQVATQQIIADRSLAQAVTNLLNNAVDVSPRNIELRVATDELDICFTVLDRGPGPGAIQARRDQEQTQGLGVGLLITRSIAAQHGGSLTFLPRDGGGSRALLQIPLQRLSNDE